MVVSKLADCVVGLGANLGDCVATLASAVAAIAHLGPVQRVSHLYRTRAVGPVQPDFLNAALRVGVPLDPVEFLDELLAIERAHGRVRRERWGPRTLDLDLLWVADVHMESQRLRIPHPELTRRAFAILPLLDVAPDAADPVTGVRYRQVAETLPESGAQRLSNASWAGPFPHAPGSRGGGWT